jgi:hypothetical protein
VSRDAPSDPFLMTGFQSKMVHLTADRSAQFDFEIDFLGDGSWKPYETIKVGSSGYERHIFPQGFSAHWIRIVPRQACTASAEFFYT